MTTISTLFDIKYLHYTMYRDELQDDEDLRIEIFHLKKQLSEISSENHLLKVKIRKLQNEIAKKDKQMDLVLDPRKSIDVRKILYERSASFLLNMKDKNDELLHLLREKDIIIKRLQNQVDITKLYSQSSKRQIQCKCSDHVELHDKIRQVQLKLSCNKSGSVDNSILAANRKKKKKTCLSWTTEIQEAESTLIDDTEREENDDSTKIKGHYTYDVKEQYKNLSREHLLSIIESLKNNQTYSLSSHQTTSRKSSPESDLERIELLCESPHEEIQQLHLHFLDMISEVDMLKTRIVELQNNQEKTDHALKTKNTNVDKLAQQIKNLKRINPKNKPSRSHGNRCYSGTELAKKVYSTGNNSINKKASEKYEREKQTKNVEKLTNLKGKKSDPKHKSYIKKEKKQVKDAMIQVDKVESPNSDTTECIYDEKVSVIITQKSPNSNKEKNEKEYKYDDDVFEICDEESAPI